MKPFPRYEFDHTDEDNILSKKLPALVRNDLPFADSRRRPNFYYDDDLFVREGLKC